MGLVDICSYASYWRGINYYEEKRVKNIKKINENEYEAIVSGTEDYRVHLDLEHPKRSTCTCPHAEGTRIVCKHKVALYFTLFPDEAKEAIEERDAYYEELDEREERIEKEMEERRKSIREYVDSLTEEEVRNELINRMIYDAYSEYEDEDEEDYYDYY